MTRGNLRGRRSIRLFEFDYTQPGAYFVTICAHNRQKIFWEVQDGQVKVNWIGRIVREEWWRTEVIRQNVFLDQFVVMPNHFHAIFHVTKSMKHEDAVRAHCNAPLHRPAKSISSMIGLFKGSATRRVRREIRDQTYLIWQRNYYERVIRDEVELNRLRRYIIENPLRWKTDREYSSA